MKTDHYSRAYFSSESWNLFSETVCIAKLCFLYYSRISEYKLDKDQQPVNGVLSPERCKDINNESMTCVMLAHMTS